MQNTSLVAVSLPSDFETTDEKKVILSGADTLRKLFEYDKLLEQKLQASPARYEKECADFHRFVRDAIPQVKKGERLEVRIIGKKKGFGNNVFRFCAYRSENGVEHYFSVHSSCFGGQRLRDVKKHERRYKPVNDAQIAA